jgi:hypothetical protein
MFVNGSGRNEHYLERTFHRCFLPSFGSFGQVVSEENIFLELNHFRGEYFLELNQSEIRIVCGGHVC